MDCAAFQLAIMDELCGELDKLTSAAVISHRATCDRCAAVFDGLRAATLPAVDPPVGLEERFPRAALAGPPSIPAGRGLARVVSVAGSWAMRPQTAMAAVFLVMIGTSGLLLRGKSSRAPASAAMTVTEEGTPAPAAGPTVSAKPRAEAPARPTDLSTSGAPPGGDLPGSGAESGGAAAITAPSTDTLNEARRPRPSPPSTASTSPSPFEAAVAAYQGRRFDEALRAFGALSANDIEADLWTARSLREATGCSAAVARFDEVAARTPGSPAGWDAALEGARCSRSLGDTAAARARLLPLLKVATFADRARAELSALSRGTPATAQTLTPDPTP